MNRTLPLLLAAVMAVPLVAADRRAEKRRLVAEVLEALDAKALTRAALDRLFTTFVPPSEMIVTDEERAFRERLYARLDHGRVSDEVYAPLFDRVFTENELRALLDFLKTDAGQKLMAVVPDLGLAAFGGGKPLLEEAIRAAQDELRQEKRQNDPVQATLADMRTVATALEARATDMNEYPTGDFDSLPALLEPVYIRQLPLVDGWGTQFLYVSDGMRYLIVSAGADRQFEWEAHQFSVDATLVETESPDADIIFEDGMFMQSPKGVVERWQWPQ